MTRPLNAQICSTDGFIISGQFQLPKVGGDSPAVRVDSEENQLKVPTCTKARSLPLVEALRTSAQEQAVIGYFDNRCRVLAAKGYGISCVEGQIRGNKGDYFSEYSGDQVFQVNQAVRDLVPDPTFGDVIALKGSLIPVETEISTTARVLRAIHVQDPAGSSHTEILVAMQDAEGNYYTRNGERNICKFPPDCPVLIHRTQERKSVV